MIIFIHLQISICNDSGESTFNVDVNTKTSLIREAFTLLNHTFKTLRESAGHFTKKSCQEPREFKVLLAGKGGIYKKKQI